MTLRKIKFFFVISEEFFSLRNFNETTYCAANFP